jgi:hypothetical protein
MPENGRWNLIRLKRVKAIILLSIKSKQVTLLAELTQFPIL